MNVGDGTVYARGVTKSGLVPMGTGHYGYRAYVQPSSVSRGPASVVTKVANESTLHTTVGPVELVPLRRPNAAGSFKSLDGAYQLLWFIGLPAGTRTRQQNPSSGAPYT